MTQTITRSSERGALRKAIESRESWRNSTGSLWAGEVSGVYAVFSYQTPIVVLEREGASDRPARWLVNSRRYSVTTSKHLGQVLPYLDGDSFEASPEDLWKVIDRA